MSGKSSMKIQDREERTCRQWRMMEKGARKMEDEGC
jgi:hypothetical protein